MEATKKLPFSGGVGIPLKWNEGKGQRRKKSFL
jgi:hypothetical protein